MSAVTVNKSCPPQLVVAHPAVLKDAVRHRFNPVRASSIDRVFIEQLQSTPLIFENCFRLLKTQSSPAARLFASEEPRSNEQKHDICVFVEPSPPTRVVPYSSSSPLLLFSKKLSNIEPTQIDGVLLSSVIDIVNQRWSFSKAASGFSEDTIIASHQAVRAKSYEATSKSRAPACLSSRPRRRELYPTARRHPFYCARRCSPTPHFNPMYV